MVSRSPRRSAKPFSPAAVREAGADLQELAKRITWPIVIQTIESMAGSTLDDLATQRFAALGRKPLYILIAERERKTAEPQAPAAVAAHLKPAGLEKIRDSFTPDFKEKRFDEG
ncbi:MAG: TPM domain-containing protein [Isosphaeraceae bacterium]